MMWQMILDEYWRDMTWLNNVDTLYAKWISLNDS
jgi:hypothetical protein